jgi:hypothetical protein
MRALLFAIALAEALVGEPAGAQKPAPCDARRDACRVSCFDRYARRDEDAFARCKEECNRAWLACSSGGGGEAHPR